VRNAVGLGRTSGRLALSTVGTLLLEPLLIWVRGRREDDNSDAFADVDAMLGTIRFVS
jgi:hypothetical protein